MTGWAETVCKTWNNNLKGNTMDPDASLSVIHRYLKEWDTRDLEDYEVEDVMRAIGALDEWMCKGGFVPRAWN